MATSPQRTFGIDVDEFCKGVGNVSIDGTPVGMIRDGSRVTLTQVTDADTEIRCAQYGGAVLGKRQGEVVYRISCEIVAFTLLNLRRALGLDAATVSALPIGRRQKLAELFLLQFFGEGTNQQTRRWSFHKAYLDTPPEILLGHQQEPCNITMNFVVCLDLAQTPDYFYGVINDYI